MSISIWTCLLRLTVFMGLGFMSSSVSPDFVRVLDLSVMCFLGLERCLEEERDGLRCSDFLCLSRFLVFLRDVFFFVRVDASGISRVSPWRCFRISLNGLFSPLGLKLVSGSRPRWLVTIASTNGRLCLLSLRFYIYFPTSESVSDCSTDDCVWVTTDEMWLVPIDDA